MCSRRTAFLLFMKSAKEHSKIIESCAITYLIYDHYIWNKELEDLI